MKRCPKCRRDYFDDSLMYCLDDGSALLEGPGSDDRVTAILPATRVPGGSTDKKAKDKVKENSIAVLPFVNLSSDPENEYFCDGVAEELISALAKVGDLKVAARSSAFSFKGKTANVSEIADALKVKAILDGSVRKSGSRLRISVHLANASDGFDIWSETFDREIRDIFEIQEEIALSVVNALKVKLVGHEKAAMLARRTHHSEAYQLYLKGRFFFAKRTESDTRRGIELFRQAIALDSEFASAHAGIADAFAVMPSFSYVSPNTAIAEARPSIERALEIDPMLSEAHMVAGLIACTYDWDWREGERRFKRAIELDARLALTRFRYAVVYLSPLGQHDQAIAEMKLAMELEPLSVIQGAVFAAVLMYARRFEEALEQARKTYELDPNHIAARHWIFHTLNSNGKYAESLALIESFGASGSVTLAQTGYAYAKSGQQQKAEDIIARSASPEKARYMTNYWNAVTWAALGKRDEAFAELEKAYCEHDWFLPLLRSDPFMDSLRDDARLTDLLKRLKLPE